MVSSSALYFRHHLGYTLLIYPEGAGRPKRCTTMPVVETFERTGALPWCKSQQLLFVPLLVPRPFLDVFGARNYSKLCSLSGRFFTADAVFYITPPGAAPYHQTRHISAQDM